VYSAIPENGKCPIATHNAAQRLCMRPAVSRPHLRQLYCLVGIRIGVRATVASRFQSSSFVFRFKASSRSSAH